MDGTNNNIWSSVWLEERILHKILTVDDITKPRDYNSGALCGDVARKNERTDKQQQADGLQRHCTTAWTDLFQNLRLKAKTSLGQRKVKVRKRLRRQPMDYAMRSVRSWLGNQEPGKEEVGTVGAITKENDGDVMDWETNPWPQRNLQRRGRKRKRKKYRESQREAR